MIIYEVNLTINNEIFDEYYEWLIDHIGLMLKFNGFSKAEIEQEIINQTDSSETSKLAVRYSVNTQEDLDEYLSYHASIMRDTAIKKFGKKFRAERRVLRILY